MARSMKEVQADLDELQDSVGDAVALLEDAYTPEATRADLVDAVSQALDLLSGEEEEEEGGNGNGEEEED